MQVGLSNSILRLSTFAVFLIISQPAASQDLNAEHLEDPPTLNATKGAQADFTGRMLAPTDAGLADEVVLELTLDYRKSRIFNPATRRNDEVRLRGYSGPAMDPEASYVAPTIESRPGDTVRLVLDNKLPNDPLCNNWDRDVNIPHCFNTTNMHSHGLWVNPAGNGDNVLLSIAPGVRFEYEYNIPPDHPAGTFWYHPHRHGSTALQLGSGMAGAWIIRGDRQPTRDRTGDVDVLLKATAEQGFEERIMVFQQIPYACPAETKSDMWDCRPGETGTIESYDQFGPDTWPASGRYTSVNGRVTPVFERLQTGDIQRWRMIHAGVRDTIRLQVVKRAAGAPALGDAEGLGPDEYTGQYCTRETVPFHVIAADGLTTAQAVSTRDVVLQPGYRWDGLFTFDQPGTYCIIDAAMPGGGTVNHQSRSRQLLGFVHVTGEARDGSDPDAYLGAQLALAAEASITDPEIRARVAAEVSELSLASFVPHRDLSKLPKEGIGDQELTFYIDTSNEPTLFMIDGKPYDPNRIDRTLELGAIDDWTLTSDFVSHPFHIHVNPFQVLEILDPFGKDVSKVDAVDDCCNGTDANGNRIVDPQFRGMSGIWKDTLMTKNVSASDVDKALLRAPDDPVPTRYTMKVRTHYTRYLGEFVLHCHILDHEDQGMMQNVAIVLPDGRGGISAPHH